MSQMAQWRDRVALITGGSSGIGLETARVLAAQGMKVAVCARRGDRLAALADDLAGTGAQVLVQSTDLRDEAQIRGLFGAIRERWGGVDVLINNAGVGHKAPLISGSSEEWRDMLELNVLALCICTREALQDMRGRGDNGHVIHISSMAGHRVPPGSGVYSATKYAVRSLTEGLRSELRGLNSGVRVTAISPGYVETEFHEIYHQSKEAAQQTYNRFKVLTSGDVAEAVVYALSQPQHVQIHDILMRPTDQTS
jgi:NADP-dependent 3-hydroxy acid dehydrogenase YdfG